MELEIEVLGPVQVRCDGVRVRLGPRLVALLSVLLVEFGRAVPANRIVAMVWGAGAPEAAPATLRSHVSHLRGALRAAGAGDPVTTLGNGHGVGYRLDTAACDVDARRFEQAYAQARPLLSGTTGDLERASRLIRDALELWRGPAYADVADRPFALPEIARLNALRRAARRGWPGRSPPWAGTARRSASWPATWPRSRTTRGCGTSSRWPSTPSSAPTRPRRCAATGCGCCASAASRRRVCTACSSPSSVASCPWRARAPSRMSPG
ncbi:BTAD domain-containing putative transcriptional regulator [Luedemannella flava]